MVDIHSHVLPGVDDGSKSMEETLKMLKLTKMDGIDTVVATPHFYRGYYENNYEDMQELKERVEAEVQKENIGIDIVLGQEIFLDKHTLDDYKCGRIRCIEKTNYMLVELPMTFMPKDALDIIYELQIKGVRPILAHPERYRYIMDEPSKINQFLHEGCFIQINTGSIKGLFGKKVKKIAEILIKNKVCSFIASDTHSTGRRIPGISEALEIACEFDSNICEKVKNNCKKVLNNEFIELPSSRIRERKSIFQFLKIKSTI